MTESEEEAWEALTPLIILSSDMIEHITAQWTAAQGVDGEIGLRWLYDSDGNVTSIAVYTRSRQNA